MQFIVSDILKKGQWGGWNNSIWPASKWKKVGKLVRR